MNSASMSSRPVDDRARLLNLGGVDSTALTFDYFAETDPEEEDQAILDPTVYVKPVEIHSTRITAHTHTCIYIHY